MTVPTTCFTLPSTTHLVVILGCSQAPVASDLLPTDTAKPVVAGEARPATAPIHTATAQPPTVAGTLFAELDAYCLFHSGPHMALTAAAAPLPCYCTPILLQARSARFVPTGRGIQSNVLLGRSKVTATTPAAPIGLRWPVNFCGLKSAHAAAADVVSPGTSALLLV